ncbi:MAG: hypothetical protein ABIK89_00880, partial [Planctomycetota bacterium]
MLLGGVCLFLSGCGEYEYKVGKLPESNAGGSLADPAAPPHAESQPTEQGAVEAEPAEGPETPLVQLARGIETNDPVVIRSALERADAGAMSDVVTTLSDEPQTA